MPRRRHIPEPEPEPEHPPPDRAWSARTNLHERAAHQVQRLAGAGLVASVRPAQHGGAILRLGPLAHEAAWLALEAFLGRPLDVAAEPG